MTLLPWQADAWRQLTAMWAQLPHALLITGVRGIGRGRFARYLAQALLCERMTTQETIAPCGQCPSCRWSANEAHPDWQILTPETSDDGDTKTRKLAVIRIDDVRQVIDFAHMTSHRGGHKVILIEPADALNPAAANALLKILEEPPQRVFFILVAEHAARLLPTVRSRCRVFPLALPEVIPARTWLHQQGIDGAAVALARAGGAPLALDAAEYAEPREKLLAMLAHPTPDAVLQVAVLLEKSRVTLAWPLEWLQKWLHDLALACVGGEARFHPDYQGALNQLAAQMSPLSVHRYADKVWARVPFGQHTLNVRLQLEALLFEYYQLFREQKRYTGDRIEV